MRKHKDQELETRTNRIFIESTFIEENHLELLQI